MTPSPDVSMLMTRCVVGRISELSLLLRPLSTLALVPNLLVIYSIFSLSFSYDGLF